jgi:hypothetical protein
MTNHILAACESYVDFEQHESFNEPRYIVELSSINKFAKSSTVLQRALRILRRRIRSRPESTSARYQVRRAENDVFAAPR